MHRHRYHKQAKVESAAEDESAQDEVGPDGRDEERSGDEDGRQDDDEGSDANEGDDGEDQGDEREDGTGDPNQDFAALVPTAGAPEEHDEISMHQKALGLEECKSEDSVEKPVRTVADDIL